jgi:antitoxin component YwqK of YwqJK toxin-antitoxin module
MKKNSYLLFLIISLCLLIVSCNKKIIIYSNVFSGLSSNPDTYNLKDTTANCKFLFYSDSDSTTLRLKGGFKDNKRHGKWIEYYRGGILKSKHKYKNGILYGKQKDFHSTGQVQIIWKFDNYNIEYIKMFDEEGNKLTKDEFMNMYF